MSAMRRLILSTSLSAVFFAPLAHASGTNSRLTTESPSFKKVLIVIFENTSYQEALNQPFFGKLAKSGALLSNFHAVSHPSLPNYIAMAAGDTFGISDDKPVRLSIRHIGDLLEAQGKDWKLYAEGFPGRCFLGSTRGAYARKHVPFLNFANIQDNPTRCAKVVSAKAFATDAANGRLPDYAMYVPDQNN